MTYIRRKILNMAEYLHPRHMQALMAGRSSEARKQIRRSLRPPPAPHDLKQAILRQYAQRFGCRILIETGTFKGDMIHAMLDDFQLLYSIELSESLHRDAVERFRENSHVQIIQGDSTHVLPDLLAGIDEPCLFWLDGHSSGGNSAKGDIETPIIEELKTILEHPIKTHVILIDDAREFGRSKGYPTLAKVRRLSRMVYPEFGVDHDIIRITPEPAKA